MGIVEQYLLQLKTKKRRWRRTAAVLTALSLLVAVGVSWNLRMTGITLANDACCGYDEHLHTEACLVQTALLCELEEQVLPISDTDSAEEVIPHIHEEECFLWENRCGYEEHIHDISCYSDMNADVETQLDWQAMFDGYPYTQNLRKDLVGIAKTQVGYTESADNFEVDAAGMRHGYTRYGAWYGAPYNEWSAMFVSFCLSYAGADLSEYPISSGADTMAVLWDGMGRFVSVGQHVPLGGDLVFLNNNTVGIVTEVQNATVYAICGDVNGAVSPIILSLQDASVVGWGVIDASVAEDVPADEEVFEEYPDNAPLFEEELTEDIHLDVWDGPVVHIFEGSTVKQQTMRRFTLRNTRSVTDLITYLTAKGGSYFYTLSDSNNVELPKDPQGNYIAQANTNYKLSITFNSPLGFLPGTYQYQVPNGLLVNGGSGDFVLEENGAIVGSWVVTDTGLITMEFNEEINDHSDITISVGLGITFTEQDGLIDFDGKIKVTVEKPPEQQFPTQMQKWGNQGNTDSGQDPTKLYWTVQIIGNKDSQIPGNILSDRILSGEWSKDHRYTASDIAGGLHFGVSEPSPATGGSIWHDFYVSPDDPHLIWTEKGWTYKIPQTATCQWCGEIELGSEGWSYTVNFTSTPDPAGSAGTYGYENEASVDGQSAYAWADFTHGEVNGVIEKAGAFMADAGGGNYVWEVRAMIPGLAQDKKADYHWYIMDYMYLLNQNSERQGYIENDMNLANVTVEYNGATLHVPRIQDATENDLFAWDNAWTSNQNGVDYGREINLLCRCQCNESNCQFWNGSCGEYWFEQDDGTWASNGFCQCWTVSENVTFTFVYETEGLLLIQNYGGIGYQVQNVAELYFKPDATAAAGALVSAKHTNVPIPGLFKKELTQDFDGYTAHYQITVNEAKAVLTNGSPLIINDIMTDTLAYISGSLVVRAEDANGNTALLQQDIHYTVTYDGTGTQTDQNGNALHVLDIVILNPQPVMYTLDYDATLVMPEQVTGAIKYKNSAVITLWGETLTTDSTEKVYADINISAKNYRVELLKTCGLTSKPLSDAVFGLYNDQGGLITSDTTDGDGKILFQTNITDGIVLREHALYYLQEIQPPTAYLPDDTKHWFVFCNKTGDSCEVCQRVIGWKNAVRIPFEQIGKVNAVNQPANYELPSTGGMGVIPYVLCGLMLISAPLVYGFSLRRKHGRRSRE